MVHHTAGIYQYALYITFSLSDFTKQKLIMVSSSVQRLGPIRNPSEKGRNPDKGSVDRGKGENSPGEEQMSESPGNRRAQFRTHREGVQVTVRPLDISSWNSG